MEKETCYVSTNVGQSIDQFVSQKKKKNQRKNMMNFRSERRMIIWSLCLIFFFSNSILVIASPAKHLCLPDQRDALWEFKNEFYVQRPDNDWRVFDQITKMWRNNTDCCSWDGVSCDPKTGNIVELELLGSSLNGPLRSNSSLFRLQHLHSLYLSYNNLSGTLPDSIGNLKYLSYFNIRGCNFFGKIPSSLGNLSYLTDLNLSDNDFTGELPDLMGLSSLSKLVYFDISGNSFSGSVPSSLFMIPSLIKLDLRRNDFSGPLEIVNITSQSNLRSFYIGENNFNGPIPRSISKLVGLTDLSLSLWNTRSGIVDFNIFLHLKSLRSLDLSYLNTRSMIDLSFFSPLKFLSEMDLSGINLKISSTLHLPSPIVTLILSSCNIYEFPKFLQNQTTLSNLDISANQIEGKVPEWFWRLPELRYVNIAQNSFSGELTMLPNFINSFIGSDNQFSGEIPKRICESVSLEMLILSDNNFSGSIPQCFKNFSLSVLHLSNNNLCGVFPEESISIGLTSLDFGHNQFSGKLPKSLINCTQLEFLNVEHNKISDMFPLWLSSLSELQVLVLRSNEFHGPISSPGDSLSFPKLRIFDISENGFNGVLPSDYFAGWSAMWSAVSSVVDIYYRMPLIGGVGGVRESYNRSLFLTNKGLNMELIGSGFKIYKTIDVSGNRFEGDIPESIGILKGLVALNMSNNAFTGHIPPSLSNLSNLQSLDLSQNRLSGRIPTELGKLTFLAVMNFSYNRLEGPIPQATQIQSQNDSSFAENPGLCGAPLQKKCGAEEEATKQEKDEDEEKEEKDQVLSWIAAVVGYVPGVLCGLTIAHILTS